MNFHAAGIFARSITLELENEYAYQTPEDYEIRVNGETTVISNRNVISLFGLLPETSYEIELLYAGEVVKNSISTKTESFLLSVRDTGAKGDGVSNDTAAIQAAISTCPEGGTVYIPEGTYLTGPLFLRSRFTLWLGKGAVLLGDPDRNDYPVLPGMIHASEDFSKEFSASSWEGNPLSSYASLITGVGVSDVDIIGEGILDGNAGASDWWVDVRNKRGAWRPKSIFLNHCNHIRIQKLQVQNSPSWTIHPYYSDNIRFIDMEIKNPDHSPNTDGIDPESCSNVEILGVRISVGDDCIALKSGKLYMGTSHYKPSEHITIRNCHLQRGHGAVTLGSEAACGIFDLLVERCIFTETDRGLRLKTRRGRGERSVLDDIRLENVRMDHVRMPLTVNMFYFCDPDGHTAYVQDQNPMPVTDKTPKIASLRMKNVECEGVGASFICVYALPEMPVDKISLENIHVRFLQENQRKKEVPLMMDNFPEMDGKSMYIRNLKTLELKDVTIQGSTDDEPELINITEKKIEGLVYA